MTQSPEDVEVLIIGAGIAGAALAYFLTQRGVTRVVVVEREPYAAYHASGRSAATLVELDPNYTVQKLKMLGGRFLRELPPGFGENPVLDQRGLVALFREPEWAALKQLTPVFEKDGLHFQLLTPREASARVDGVLVESQFAGAAFLPENGFLDVHELLTSYMKHARQRGAQFRFRTEVLGLLVEQGTCRGVRTTEGPLRARLVVNAAGAWVGKIAEGSGALTIGFQQMRRSIVVFKVPDDARVRGWPLVWSEAHRLYFRPESGGVLFCPMDEGAMPPCDPGANDTAIAEGLERLRALAPSLVPRTLGRRWAGLRTFAPDRVPVVGEDPQLHGFFWLAGQGGCGIETSPILGEVATDLITSGKTERFDRSLLAPERFAGR
jgi:D-arginine dehydrogenase